MTAAREKELLLLCALDVYRTWHTVGFLAAKGLIPAGWPEADVRRAAAGLAGLGEVRQRRSESKQQLMYRITETGIRRLAVTRPAIGATAR